MDIQNQDKEYWFNLVVDHLTGSISDENRLLLAGWRNSSKENEQQFVEIQKMWQMLSVSSRDETFDEQRAYRLFKERITAEAGVARRKPMARNQLFKRIIRYAAVLVPIAVLSYFTYRYFMVASGYQEMPLLMSEVSVPNGSKTQMKLQDGTVVWLNAGSRIQYDSDFAKANRVLSLSGEAYFEVARDKHIPFIVNVGDLKIKVLGTRFNVNAYEENDGVNVSLLQGSVEMDTEKGDIFVLKPGDVACYNTVTGETAISTNAMKNTLAWVSNILVFSGETFEQIVHTLERNFDVKVNIHNEQIKTRRFAGDFTNNETIEQIFTVMSVNGKFRYRIKGNVIDIY